MHPDDNASTSSARRQSRGEFYGEHVAAVDSVHAAQLSHRSGSVLSKDTILKLEHYQLDNDQRSGASGIRLFGAPNYRRSSTLHVYGVAQPDLAGLQTVLRLLCPQPAFPTSRTGLIAGMIDAPVRWVNSREEPMLYIAGRPFVLREVNAPFRNIEAFAGISGARLEQMEERLKADVLEEAQLHGGLVIVHEEFRTLFLILPHLPFMFIGRELIPCLMAADRVQTTREVFDELAASFNVCYTRIPVSRGQSPFDSFIDDLFRLFRETPVTDPVVFSCGMGIGRSMVCAVHLIYFS